MTMAMNQRLCGYCGTMKTMLVSILLSLFLVTMYRNDNNVWTIQSITTRLSSTVVSEETSTTTGAVAPLHQQLRSAQQPQHLTTTNRRALLEDVVRDFVPLSCNANIMNANVNTSTCQLWSTKFGNTQEYYTQRVVIPCGECIIMDYHNENDSNSNTFTNATTSSKSITNTITFMDGIDIIGKLIIPDNDSYKIHITTTLIVVQGILEMTSISTPVSGTPNVHITMIRNTNDDSSSTKFTPVNENAEACLSATCEAGTKGIVVAGGSLNIHGIPSDTPTWVHMYDVAVFGRNDTVFLPKSILGKWNVGAEIVITSHTMIWNATQVRTIEYISKFFSPSADYVTVRFNESIVHPTTIKESPDFAVEVALLSRNIVLEGAVDDDMMDHGGHLLISYTPNVIQTIEGVEIRNFGQQGVIGRYPIHFHYCNNVTGSIVSKNTIRQSNQRCIVVHGTNQLKIEQNVAFDTKGHCYMTEDGNEIDNEFLYNIGIQIGIPNKLIPDEGPNGNETDHEPSIFWITNPTNVFIGNVAAGSEHSGYWFEPKLRGIRAYQYPMYNPMYEPLTLFKDNVAHSCSGGKLGAIRTYTPGYRPYTWAVFDGLKVYRNVGVGIFIHRCHNIRIENSLVADNYIGIDIDRAEGIAVNKTIIIGESESYRIMKKRQKVSSVCSRQGNLIGLDLHTWKSNLSLAGATFEDVEFRDFDRRANCKSVSSVAFDKNTLKDGLFEFFASFRRISFKSNFLGISMTAAETKLNLCLVQAAEFDMIYASDIDGSLSPGTMLSTGPSSLLASDSDQMLTFVNASDCNYVSAGCYHYCQNTCFRSVRYSYEGVGQDDLTLRVCKLPISNQSLCTTFRGGRRGDRGAHAYIAHLPVGSEYNATLVNSSGIEITTGTLNEYYEASSCAATATFSVIYVGPIIVANKDGNALLEDAEYTSNYDDDGTNDDDTSSSDDDDDM